MNGDVYAILDGDALAPKRNYGIRSEIIVLTEL